MVESHAGGIFVTKTVAIEQQRQTREKYGDGDKQGTWTIGQKAHAEKTRD